MMAGDMVKTYVADQGHTTTLQRANRAGPPLRRFVNKLIEEYMALHRRHEIMRRAFLCVGSVLRLASRCCVMERRSLEFLFSPALYTPYSSSRRQ